MNINLLYYNVYRLCGIGVYLCEDISEVELYFSEFLINGINVKCILMCRVNPYKIRICKNNPILWIVSGDRLNDLNGRKYDDEIRPYRILIKGRR